MEITEELSALYRRWMEAVQQNDMATLDEIVGQDYVYVASGQGRKTREEWMATVSVYEIRSFALLDLEVRTYGEGTVAATLAYIRQEALVGGQTRSGTFLITDVWVHREGRWQVVARSSIREAPAA